jgi:hypothetical protein
MTPPAVHQPPTATLLAFRPRSAHAARASVAAVPVVSGVRCLLAARASVAAVPVVSGLRCLLAAPTSVALALVVPGPCFVVAEVTAAPAPSAASLAGVVSS